jgi:chemotaxis protein CheD
MKNDTTDPVPADYFLEPGYVFVATRPVIISGVLGSCVSVCLYDPKQKIGGMNHFRFPQTADRRKASTVYGNVATIALIRMMRNEGAKDRHLEAQIFGGAFNRAVSPKNIGRENVTAARRILARERIRIRSEDIGGEVGRKIVFNTASNEIAVLKVERLRAGDWFPYESNR